MLASLRQEPLCRSQNFRHTGLVVGPQEGRAIGDDQVLAHVSGQGLIFLRLQRDALLLVQEDVSPIVLDDSGLDIFAGGIRSRIHVGDQADGGQALISGNGAVNIAHFVHVGIGNAHRLHFLRQGSPQHLLPRGRGSGAGEFIGGGLIAYIAQEALDNRFHILFLSFLVKTLSWERVAGPKALTGVGRYRLRPGPAPHPPLPQGKGRRRPPQVRGGPEAS